MNLIVIFWSCFLAVVVAEDAPKVILPEYTVIGVDYTTPDGNHANAFFGMPYAEPPLGELRHEKPVPLRESATKIVEAFEYASACLIPLDVPNQSEDCLYLNVFTPRQPAPKEGYPVLVFIHGGGFSYGSAKIYGGDGFIDNFVQQGIVATLQYRLHWFGFLTIGDDDLPGNIGLWDQNAALKFIHKNIKYFGGNPDEITLMGHSAGSASTHAHSISPHSRNLIKRFIPMSGSLYASWAIGDPHNQPFQKILNEKLGCPQINGAELKKCAKKINASLVTEISSQLPQVAFDIARLHWRPVLDKDFFGGKTLDELAEESPAKPVLYGLTSSEAMIMTFSHPNFLTSAFALDYGITKDQQSSFTLENYHEKMDNLAFKPERTGCQSKLIQELIEKFYLSNLTAIRTDPKYYYKSWNNVLSDLGFNVPIHYEIDKKLQSGWKDQFVFLFDWVDPNEVDSYLGVNQCPHAYDIQFLTDMRAYSLDKPWTPLQLQIQKNLVEFFTNFIKTGNPGENWPKVTNADKLEYMKISDKMEPGNTFFNRSFLIWKTIIEILGYRLNVANGESLHNYE
uniref:Carboxylic ester hydrolase n=1 Tax=Panagrolaimus sp. JU765 TaxID=591449 RepID=A0AC34R8Q3_9BILA